MEWKHIEGKWSQYADRVRQHWNALSIDEVQAISGRREQLIGALQRYYGVTKDQAGRQIDEFCARLDLSPQDKAPRKAA